MRPWSSIPRATPRATPGARSRATRPRGPGRHGARAARDPWAPEPRGDAALASSVRPQLLLGAVDDPDRQRRVRGEWVPHRDGALLVLGARGSGAADASRSSRRRERIGVRAGVLHDSPGDASASSAQLRDELDRMRRAHRAATPLVRATTSTGWPRGRSRHRPRASTRSWREAGERALDLPSIDAVGRRLRRRQAPSRRAARGAPVAFGDRRPVDSVLLLGRRADRSSSGRRSARRLRCRAPRRGRWRGRAIQQVAPESWFDDRVRSPRSHRADYRRLRDPRSAHIDRRRGGRRGWQLSRRRPPRGRSPLDAITGPSIRHDRRDDARDCSPVDQALGLARPRPIVLRPAWATPRTGARAGHPLVERAPSPRHRHRRATEASCARWLGAPHHRRASARRGEVWHRPAGAPVGSLRRARWPDADAPAERRRLIRRARSRARRGQAVRRRRPASFVTLARVGVESEGERRVGAQGGRASRGWRSRARRAGSRS